MLTEKHPNCTTRIATRTARTAAVPDLGPSKAPEADIAPFSPAETSQERDQRCAVRALGITVFLVVVIAGAAVVARDLRRCHRKDLSA